MFNKIVESLRLICLSVYEDESVTFNSGLKLYDVVRISVAGKDRYYVQLRNDGGIWVIDKDGKAVYRIYEGNEYKNLFMLAWYLSGLQRIEIETNMKEEKEDVLPSQ